ncbi:MAG: family transcriptional regulator [Clostridiaceae bacterium]|jgi:transcriptional regulator with XRE-family HTH domain|nr:family transcriptional regulator [Clostridiaceae bacterium]
MSIFSDRLKKLRTDRKGLFQSEIAEVIGVDASAYSKYERGINEPDIETLIKIANYFEVTVDFLVGNDSKSNVSKKALQEYLNDLEKGFINLKKYVNNSK